MQIEQRKKYLGGTDTAGVLGLSRWTTPLHVWAEKTGQIENKELDSEAAELGIYLEEYVARRFSKETGLKVHRVNETIFHKEYPFLGANIDRRVVGDNAILECKTASAWKSKEWDGEEIPHEYILQVYHYMIVTGAAKAYISVLIGNQDFKWKVIERDEALLSDILKHEVSFWKDFVEPKVMPGIITANDKDTLYQLYPSPEKDSQIQLTDEANQIIERRNALYQDCISLEKMIEVEENKLRAMLGEKETGTTGNWKVSWKGQKTTRLDTDRIKSEAPELYKKYGKESLTRRLTIKEIKANAESRAA